MTSRSNRKSAAFDPIDVHVGRRVRLRRKLLGMSQTMLGDALGVTFQQLQKYERGANRISASRLFELGKVLDVPISFFFDDMPADIEQKPPTAMPADPMNKREVLELIGAYYAIPDEGIRKSLFDMLKTVAKLDSEKDQSSEAYSASISSG